MGGRYGDLFTYHHGQAVETMDHFEVRNPSTGELVGRAPQAGRDELDRAGAAAARAFENWSKTSDEEL